jgi:hypothetical protein
VNGSVELFGLTPAPCEGEAVHPVYFFDGVGVEAAAGWLVDAAGCVGCAQRISAGARSVSLWMGGRMTPFVGAALGDRAAGVPRLHPPAERRDGAPVQRVPAGTPILIRR